jgi:Spy/CpxP family protein refolding chaperone
MRILGLAVVLAAAALLLTQHTYSNSRHYEQCRYLYTDNEIQELLNGEGISIDHDEELNQYPGPNQVLAAADELGLSREQVQKITAINEQMRRDAVSLGRAIMDQEKELEQLISTGASTDAANLMLREVAEKHQKLHDIHLAAHVQVKSQLTPEQLEEYHRLHAHQTAHTH